MCFAQIPVQGVTWRVQMIVPTEKLAWPQLPPGRGAPVPVGRRTLRHLGTDDIQAAVYTRSSLAAGHALAGPALIVEPLATTLVMPDQAARIGGVGEIIITGVA